MNHSYFLIGGVLRLWEMCFPMPWCHWHKTMWEDFSGSFRALAILLSPFLEISGFVAPNAAWWIKWILYPWRLIPGEKVILQATGEPWEVGHAFSTVWSRNTHDTQAAEPWYWGVSHKPQSVWEPQWHWILWTGIRKGVLWAVLQEIPMSVAEIVV